MPSRTNDKKMALVESQEGMKSLTKALGDSIAEILPRHVSPARIIKTALVASTREPKLLQCTKESMMLALMAAAELGLDVSGNLGTGWLVPFFNGKLKAFEAVFIPGWKGLVQIAYRSGKVGPIHAAAVYECDGFSYTEMPPELIHSPARPRDCPERGVSIEGVKWEKGKLKDPGHMAGSLLGTYVTWTVNGERGFHWVWAEKIEELRLAAQAPVSPAWMNWTEAMSIKTAVRGGIPYMPLSVEDQQSIVLAQATEDQKLGLGAFIDVAGGPVSPDGAHTLNEDDDDPLSGEDEEAKEEKNEDKKK